MKKFRWGGDFFDSHYRWRGCRHTQNKNQWYAKIK